MDNEGLINFADHHSLQGQRLELDFILKELQRDGFIDAADAERCRRSAQIKRRTPINPMILIGAMKIVDRRSPGGVLSLEALTAWLAAKAGLAYQHIDPLKLDVHAITGLNLPLAYLERFNIMPVKVSDDQVVMATAEPFVDEWVKELSQVLRKKIERVIVNPADILRYRHEFFALAESVRGASNGRTSSSQISDFEQLVTLGRAGKLDASDQHVVHIVDWLLQYAFNQRASDIHLEPRRENANIRFRIDGVLHHIYQIPQNVMNAVTSRIKVLGRMDVAEKRRPQDGRLKTVTPNGEEVELRLSTMPTTFGEKLVMRIFDPEALKKSFQELGFSDDELKTWRGMVESPHGIILVTGPTGSGKTTTLYSTLRHLARPELNVCTIEDPIEIVDPKLNQMQVQPAIGVNFASGVRTLLRQDPDIIMVGEIRDFDTADIAVQASLTGHLVLSTLHTNDSATAITRLLDLGISDFLIQATLLGVTAQRLVRTLCPFCKKLGPIDDHFWHLLTAPWKIKKPEHIYHPVGCSECRRTGYLGRTAIFEIMLVTPELAELISSSINLEELRRQSVNDGMRPLRLSGANAVVAGLTTPEEVFKVAPPPRNLGSWQA
ncbi:MAG: type II/IV secretion system protein [Deltaproteobacteria bacterium]|nr:type II/IV secretion system protein [Deltaproteobacteria bacterium]